MGWLDRFRPKPDADRMRTIEDLSQAIAAQKQMGLPMPIMFPVGSNEGYTAEQHLQAVKEGTPLGLRLVKQRKRFYACVKS